VLIIFEMTGSYGLILPLMIANMTSYGISRMYRPNSIYEALLEQDGIILPDDDERSKHAFEFLRVRDAYNPDIVTLRDDLTVEEALESVGRLAFSIYPIIAPDGRCVGTISEARLRRTLAEKGGDKRIRSVAGPVHTVSPGVRVSRAVAKMNKHRVRQLAVVSTIDERFLGILSMTDIVRAEAAAIMARKDVQPDQSIEIHESRTGTRSRTDSSF